MGHKFQDSIPRLAIWEGGKNNGALASYAWGYDSLLTTLSIPKSITGGKIIVEGYCGYDDVQSGKWGEWYQLGMYDVLYNSFLFEYDLSLGSRAFYSTIVGFSECRVRLIEPLEGEGRVNVGIACHAANWR